MNYRRDEERFRQMPETELDRCREELREWFRSHPYASPADAVRALNYPLPDQMYAVADGEKIDLLRAQRNGHVNGGRQHPLRLEACPASVPGEEEETNLKEER